MDGREDGTVTSICGLHRHNRRLTVGLAIMSTDNIYHNSSRYPLPPAQKNCLQFA